MECIAGHNPVLHCHQTQKTLVPKGETNSRTLKFYCLFSGFEESRLTQVAFKSKFKLPQKTREKGCRDVERNIFRVHI